MSKNDGGPAFPLQPQLDGSTSWNISGGMSIRDWFAGMALMGWMAGDERHFHNSEHDALLCKANTALRCYQYADAMLAEREK